MAPAKKKSKKNDPPPVSDHEDEPNEDEPNEDEDELEAEPDAQEDAEEVGGGGDEGGGGRGGGRILSEEEKAEREAGARKRRRAVARRKGYRFLATKSGYSMSVASADPSRDVAQNVLSVKEATRACKWAPALPDKVAYATVEEYNERLKLQSEPLPQGPAAVFRASGEVFLRKVFNESVQRAFDDGKTRVSVNHVMGVLRPLQRVLKFSFVAPTGLVRHAQMTTVGPEGKEAVALGSLDTDEAQISKELKVILPKQIEAHKAMVKAAAEAKKAKEAKKNGEPEPERQPKKKKSKKAAA